MSPPETILLTGATGMLGTSILDYILTHTPHHVHAPVRSLAKAASFLTSKYPTSNLTLHEIPNLATPNAFDDLALKCDVIIHVATPLPSPSPNLSPSEYHAIAIAPTWDINRNILSAAHKSGGKVKRVVLCSTILTVLGFQDLGTEKTFTTKDWNSITIEEAMAAGDGGAYALSKTFSEKKAWEYMASLPEGEKTFDLVTLCAPAITGRCIQEGFVPSKNSLGGNAVVYRELFDRSPEQGLGTMFPWVMDVEDVAKIHVLAAVEKDRVEGGKRYLFAEREKVSSGMVAKRVREEFSGLRGRVLEPREGDWVRLGKADVDVEEAERVFGYGEGGDWKLKGWWEGVKGCVEDIVELEKK